MPLDTTVCQLKANPPEFNHKLIRVTGFVSHGLEDFTLIDPQCSSWPGVWLEYGGRASSGTVYLGGGKPGRKRAKNLVVESIPISLIVDKQFQEFDKAIQPPFPSGAHGAVLRATLIGRFFSGRKLDHLVDKPWGGFGHLGCCTLFAIEEVEAADTQHHPELDYDSSIDEPHIEKPGCVYDSLLPLDSSRLLKWQGETDRGDHLWALDDPKRVALIALSREANVDVSRINELTLSRDTPARKVYVWEPKSTTIRYLVVVSRPYWLSFSAPNITKVAWTATAVTRSSCEPAH